jgi:hypothetical protein
MSPWHIVLIALAGWLNREQQKVIEYPKEENRVLSGNSIDRISSDCQRL